MAASTNNNGNPTILATRRQARLPEDSHDLAVVADRRAEPPISLAALERRLHRKAGNQPPQPPQRPSR
jgi:hypothetical protein